jgi:hypothetical protein
MVNENHFQFDRITFFNFWKTIYGFKNRKSFFEIKLFIFTRTFDTRLPKPGNGQSSESGWHWNPANIRPPEYCRRGNPATSDHRRQNGQKPVGSGQNGRNLVGSDRICMDQATDPGHFGRIWRDPEESGRNPAILTEFGQTCSPKSGNGDCCIFHIL